MSDIDESMSVAEVAAVVSEVLEAAGLEAVLSGGSVVTIYSDNEYESFDLDFVTSERMSRIEEAMRSIGFQRASARHFEHPCSRYFVEFPAGPLSIGDEVVHSTARLPIPAGTIRMLSPTQCVMDRRAAFYHWNDRQGLEQATMVALRHDVDRRQIQTWSIREGHADGFEEFVRRVDASRKT